jgi:hypothetical protein
MHEMSLVSSDLTYELGSLESNFTEMIRKEKEMKIIETDQRRKSIMYNDNTKISMPT